MSLLSPLAMMLGLLAAPQVDLTVSVGGALAESTPYEHRYVPRVDFDPTSGGTARQSLRFDAGKGPLALQLALAVRLSPRSALEASVLASSWSLDGTSGPHVYRLDYTSRQPPDGALVPQTLARSTPWPDPEGRVRHLVLAAGFERRLMVASRTIVSLFLGPSLHRVGGELRSLAYLTARAGGHGVLFTDEHALEVTADPRWTIGVAGGASIQARVKPSLGVVFGARYYRAATPELQPRVTAVVNADQLLSGLDAAEIARRFTPEPLRFRSSFLHASIGIQVSR